MCSAQIGCEVNKHYFSTEFSYKMTRNLPMGIGGKKERKEREKSRNLLPEGREEMGTERTLVGLWGAEVTPCSLGLICVAFFHIPQPIRLTHISSCFVLLVVHLRGYLVQQSCMQHFALPGYWFYQPSNFLHHQLVKSQLCISSLLGLGGWITQGFSPRALWPHRLGFETQLSYVAVTWVWTD